MTQALAKTTRKSLMAGLAEEYGLDPVEFKNTIKATCFPAGKATDEQLFAFLSTAKQYGLNPLVKQIFAFPSNGGIIPIVGADGWAAIVNSHPQFDGMEFAETREQGRLAAVTCRIFRKDRGHPTEATERMDECVRNTDVWRKWPHRMLRHKAFIQCARMAFSLTGIYEPDEAIRIEEAEQARQVPQVRRKSDPAPVLEVTEADIIQEEIPPAMGETEQPENALPVTSDDIFDEPEPQPEPAQKKITPAQRKRLFAIAKERGADDLAIKAYLIAEWNLEHTSDILQRDYDAICAHFEGGDD